MIAMLRAQIETERGNAGCATQQAQEAVQGNDVLTQENTEVGFDCFGFASLNSDRVKSALSKS